MSYCNDHLYLFKVKDENFKTSTEDDSSNNGRISISEDSELPPVKRLRLRGDWSDTGPQARPDADEEDAFESNLMQRMSELFSRWVEGAMSSALRSTSASSEDEIEIPVPTQNPSTSQSSNENELENTEEQLPSSSSQNTRDEEVDETTPLLSRNAVSETQTDTNVQRVNQETQVTAEMLINSGNENHETDIVHESDSEMQTAESSSETPAEISNNLIDATNTTTHTDSEENNRVSFTDEFRERLKQSHTSESRYTAERQFAAAKIQSFIRLHKERQRELKLMNAYKPSFIYTPEVKNVFKGHRNARTMVCYFL